MKINGKHKPLTEEMILDLSRMGDQEFMSKWDTSRQYPIRARKRLGISSYINQHGTQEHKIEDGKEYKWCQAGHWEIVENFGKHTSRWDGLRGHCKIHSNQSRRDSYDRTDGASVARRWLQTEKGKKSRSETMRRMWMKRRSYYVKFEIDDEERVYKMCGCCCAYCKTPTKLEELEFDHFIPINSGGMTEPSNMLPACKQCNRGRGGKFDKDPYQWLMERFGAYYGEQIYVECVSILERLKCLR